MSSSIPATYANPIVPGFHPDPTVCRVGDDYYLAHSTFTYFPGVPVFQSRDLVNWRLLGHVLTRPSQFPPRDQGHSEGIFAPTLRHDGRRFWLITTNIGGGGTFVCTAERPEGPWSDPVFLDDAPGIDPSLLFDDGRVWVTGTADVPEGGKYFGDNEIWLRELDPDTLKWKGPRTGLWRGALKDVVWVEGPHLYKRGSWYYLVISEAGTGVHHAVTVARSQTITGPYEGHRANPILTHRHLGSTASVINVGHPDLVETAQGEWWMVLLASRPLDGVTHRGRETFLVPVVWEGDWPVVSPGTGKVEAAYPRPNLPWTPWPGEGGLDGFDGFDAPALGPRWQYLRCPDRPVADLAARPGWLRLRGTEHGPGTRLTQAWVGRAVAHRRWHARVFLEAQGARRAGLCVFQSDDYHVRLEALAGTTPGVRVVTRVAGTDTVVHEAGFPGAGPRIFEVGGEGHQLWFRWSVDGAAWTEGPGVDGRFLTTEAAGGFVGCLVGPFAVDGDADVDWFDYRGQD